MTLGEQLTAWLSSHDGELVTYTKGGVSSVMACAYGIAASVTLKDVADRAEVHRGEIEAIWQLKQLVED